MKSLLFTAILIVSSLGFAAGALDGEYTTGYINQAGIIDVKIEENAATLTINPNNCILNAIGSPQICTVIGVAEVKGELKLDLETSGKHPRGTSLYRVEGTDFGIVSFKNMHASYMRIVRYNPENKDVAVFAAPLLAK